MGLLWRGGNRSLLLSLGNAGNFFADTGGCGFWDVCFVQREEFAFFPPDVAFEQVSEGFEPRF